jgi:hypothetical protein
VWLSAAVFGPVDGTTVQFGPRLTGDIVEHIGARDVAELVAVSCAGRSTYLRHVTDLAEGCSTLI